MLLAGRDSRGTAGATMLPCPGKVSVGKNLLLHLVWMGSVHGNRVLGLYSVLLSSPALHPCINRRVLQHVAADLALVSL